MSHKLTKRHIRSVKKMMEHKGEREARKQQKVQRSLERAQLRSRGPRQRDWLDDEDAASFEKMRRLRIESYPVADEAGEAVSAGVTGTVIEVRAGESLVSCERGVVRASLAAGLLALVPSTRSPLAVGDRVSLEPLGAGEARIVAVLPRRSALRRSVYDPLRDSAAFKGQVMAANIDQVVLVCSPSAPPFRARLIDRYLVAAALDAIPAVICLNKCDLGVPAEVEADLEGYGRLGVRVVRTSAETGAGVGVLRDSIAGGVSIFTGHSGVGKSSLLNALEPGLQLKVGTVTEATAGQGKGRHTTSSARLVPLSLRDTFVVDSPGIRAFGIRGLEPRELASLFPGVASVRERCGYRDCRHDGEPDCAVERAACGDAFLRARLESYRGVLREL